MAKQMKGISCCGDCAYFISKRCIGGGKDAGSAQDPFYKDCPLPDVVERKRGEWVWPNVAKKRDRPYCSVCLNDAFWDDDYGFVTESFCPNCGADMREKGNG